jgi:hypothetical protein
MTNPAQISTPEQFDQLDDGPVRAQIPSLFLQLLLKQPATTPVFQPDPQSTSGEAGAVAPDPDIPAIMSLLDLPDRTRLNKVAVLLVAQAISGISVGGFSGTIRADNVQQQLAEMLATGVVERTATAVYAVKFFRRFSPVVPGLSITPPAVVQQGGLAAGYATYITRPGYLVQKVASLSTGAPSALRNVLLVTYKLRSLSASAYENVASVYQKVNLPVFQSTWTDLVSVSLVAYDVFPEVQKVATTTDTTFSPSLSYSDVSDSQSVMKTVTIGASVAAFIRKELAPRGLATDQKPDNVIIQEVP